jgi:prostaglandin-endoperoxide synthase 2
MYGDIDSVEWFVGLFAEDHGPEAMMGELLTTMVACDAFTQALTNPPLSRNVFNEDTFTATGLRIIRETSGIADLGARNAEPSATPRIARFATPRR